MPTLIHKKYHKKEKKKKEKGFRVPNEMSKIPLFKMRGVSNLEYIIKPAGFVFEGEKEKKDKKIVGKLNRKINHCIFITCLKGLKNMFSATFPFLHFVNHPMI